MHKGWPKEQKDCPEILHPYWTFRECISLENGLLFKDDRLIIPEAERDQILELLHYGHYGITRTQDRAKNQYFGQALQETLRQGERLHNLPRECTESNQRDYAAS